MTSRYNPRPWLTQKEIERRSCPFAGVNGEKCDVGCSCCKVVDDRFYHCDLIPVDEKHRRTKALLEKGLLHG
jgi:hypothetical protein